MIRALVLLCLVLAACDHDKIADVQDPPGAEPATGAGPGTGDGTGPGAGTEAETEAVPDDCTGLAAEPADATWTLRHAGLDRIFDVHVPPSYRPTRAVPLVLNFHGYGSNKAQQALISRMKEKSDAEGFVAVHPQGTGVTPLVLSWNGGTCCGSASTLDVDDVGFVAAMLDMLQARLCIDRRRVYTTGFSNGGVFSHRLACDLHDRIAAAAPVSGTIMDPSCTLSRPVPLLHTHGTADPVVPYAGNLYFPSVAKTVADWAARDDCTEPAAETYRDGNAHCEARRGCAGGAEVLLCTIDGGVHMWPGGVGDLYADIDGTSEIWKFLSRWTLP